MDPSELPAWLSPIAAVALFVTGDLAIAHDADRNARPRRYVPPTSTDDEPYAEHDAPLTDDRRGQMAGHPDEWGGVSIAWLGILAGQDRVTEAVAHLLAALEGGKVQAAAAQLDGRIWADVEPKAWRGASLDPADHLVTFGRRRPDGAVVPADDLRAVQVSRDDVLALIGDVVGGPADGPRDAVYLSGAPGRPTSMQLVVPEHGRRMDAGIALPKLKDEAKALADWLREKHPGAPSLKPNTIAKHIGPAHRAYRKAAK